MDIKNALFELCSQHAVSGCEQQGAETVKRLFKPFADIRTAPNGNLFAELKGDGARKTILLDSHMDRIGFLVTEITDEGFAKIEKCGGADVRTLQDSVLVSADGLTGVVCCMPPHLSDGNEDKATPFSKSWVDFGMTGEELRSRLSIGDTLTFSEPPAALLGDRVTSPATDDRSGVACLLRVAELLSGKSLPYNVVILLSAQEETFGSGAKTGAYSADPDEAIAVDVSFASQPDISGMYSKIGLGKGAMIAISPTTDRAMSEKLRELAEAEGLPFQLEPLAGRTGTNADHISVSRSGVRTAVLSIPQRYMHTQAEVVAISDIENTARLIAAYILSGGVGND